MFKCYLRGQAGWYILCALISEYDIDHSAYAAKQLNSKQLNSTRKIIHSV